MERYFNSLSKGSFWSAAAFFKMRFAVYYIYTGLSAAPFDWRDSGEPVV